jgi:hypothetical protein
VAGPAFFHGTPVETYASGLLTEPSSTSA